MTMPCRNTAALEAKMREDDERFNEARRMEEREAFLAFMIEQRPRDVFELVHDDFPDALGGAFGAWTEYLADGDDAAIGRLYRAACEKVVNGIFDADKMGNFGWPGMVE